jgi:glutamyl-tRNA reductase
VPRDVDPSAADVPGVTVHDIDAVQQMVGRNLAARRRAARTATAMVHREAERFSAWRRELDAAPAVRSVWRQAEQLRRDELARVADALTAEEHDRLERVTASLLVKLLHGPCERLRAACVGPDGATQVENFRMLFGVGSDGHGEATNVITMPRRGAA